MFLGIDFGTSGARACVIAPGGQIEDMAREDFGALPEHEAAATWREVLLSLIAQIPAGMRKRLAALRQSRRRRQRERSDATSTPTGRGRKARRAVSSRRLGKRPVPQRSEKLT